ncbi:diaminopimelate epimerase [Gammaproteobacteria bacterium]|nr:diaminopimelate epimerase [Gammaproteobacteria bacterium]
MPILDFCKMHALGNDFVIINAINTPFNLNAKQIDKLGERTTGIGFDQLLVILPSDEIGVDFCYQIYNQDGREAGNCGNGVRCAALYIHRYKLSSKRTLHFKTKTIYMHATILEHDADFLNAVVKVDMGIPNFKPESLPFIETLATKTLNNTFTLNNSDATFSIASIGNPHAVVILDDINMIDLRPIAYALQNHRAFPEGVNVGFMHILSRNLIKLRVHERGVGETDACGTGACAAVAVGISSGLLDSAVEVRLQRGDLNILWESASTPLFMTGPACFVFEGTIR